MNTESGQGTSEGTPGVAPVPGNTMLDADGDGMPDLWNQRMPAIAFVFAMLALIPLLFATRASVTFLRNEPGTSGGWAYTHNIFTVILSTVVIIAAAYGVRAKTGGLAKAARRIAICELVLSLIW